METSSPLLDTTVSIVRAIDGSHLGWSDFRTTVLGAFRIVLTETIQLSDLSRPFSDRLKPCLQNLTRFTKQEREWRSQLASGQGFGSTIVFPPNVLPPISSNRSLHRCLAPKLNREALPPRAVKAQESLFELPAPRPGLLTGFATAAFNERELSILPNCASGTGTIVDFESGCVSPGTTTYCPFLVFERMNITSEDAVQSAKNQCAIAGAHCIRALQLLFRRCTGPRPVFERPVSFSCAIDNPTALIHYHYVDTDGRYCMSEISRFNLDDSESFFEFQGWIEAIEEWGSAYLLPVIKIALRQLLKSNGTPPISPMPSLSLSIDTAAGSEELLMKILRTTFGSIKWKCDGEYETPMNSSVAHCGTPVGARKIRTLALSPTSPIDALSAVSGPTTPFSVWRMKPDWGTKSPIARRHPLSPLKLHADFPESPCRRATLSPCTPPPEAPYSSKSPMLVLQKRVDLAMDEIQELRALVQSLQSELQLKNSQLNSSRQKQEQVLQELPDDSLRTPTPTKHVDWDRELELPSERKGSGAIVWSSRVFFCQSLGASTMAMICLLFLSSCVIMGHNMWESVFCLATILVNLFVAR
ncbi:uncharacterized protein Z518_02417 [Rhinocladiella mackenziei CBS 650.93]|uniref:DUF7924 domain-containing protein n=1 Tax=Rhinocladiella mackenziei CBS 650.93 TaxID=1442369 RepID=A0A0D2HBE7_9EURO|nr:uncharacterized protein Z518_02417 [Rhinocladiella mackenziei CBS 650.93]KIX07763.1 hypothetical protein Z518_02417 [Rhinocladiella mackenziei CBS 650.93]